MGELREVVGSSERHRTGEVQGSSERLRPAQRSCQKLLGSSLGPIRFVPNGPFERLREAQKSSYNQSFKTYRFCYQISKQLLHFVVRSVPVDFGGLPSSSDVSLPHSFSSIWIDRRRARAHLSVSETRLGRQASSESAFQNSGDAFG